jgi:hypothetical protein
MALNPNISLGVRPLQVPDPLAQMAQVSQIQSSQRQNEAAQMQLEQLKQDRVEMQQFQSQIVANGGNADLDLLAKTMLKTPKFFAQGVELTRKLKEQADFEDYGRRLHPELFGATARTPSAMGQGAAPVAQNALGTGTEPVNALATSAAPTAAPVNALAAPSSEPYPGYNEAIGMTPSAAPARAQQLSPSGKTRQQLQGEIYMAQRNPLFKGLAETAKLELAEMMKAPVYHNVPGVGLVNPITKETVVPSKAAPPTPLNVTRLIQERDALPKGHPNIAIYNDAIRKETQFPPRAAEGGAAPKPMTQAQRVKYNKDKVSDKDVVTGAFAVTGELEKLTDELVGNPDKKIAPAPGLSSITGFSALTNPLALPSGDARKALQKLETFKGKIMALGRQLASQEGKLGNMAVQEWKFVSDAVQKIDPAAGNLDEQMRDVVRQAREYSQRQQSKYDDTYADDLTAPAKPALSPIDKQALEWANSNSADPRAAAIKQRLGK